MHKAQIARIEGLLRVLKAHYKKDARTHLPWRSTRDPYRVLVSEIMLQQTQVERVIPKFNSFIKKFPNWRALARASLSDVLREWQGLGYNRRGKYLHEAAKIVARDGYNSQKLPGVGPYTAGAIAAFAFNKPEVFIETNIRTVFLHFCFFDISKKVEDRDILPLVTEALKKSKMQPRDFYAALMDYGSYLKASGVKLNARSKHYTKQSKFKGSTRQLRGAILRELLIKKLTMAQLNKKFPDESGRVREVLESLAREGLVSLARAYWTAD